MHSSSVGSNTSLLDVNSLLCSAAIINLASMSPIRPQSAHNDDGIISKQDNSEAWEVAISSGTEKNLSRFFEFSRFRDISLYVTICFLEILFHVI